MFYGLKIIGSDTRTKASAFLLCRLFNSVGDKLIAIFERKKNILASMELSRFDSFKYQKQSSLSESHSAYRVLESDENTENFLKTLLRPFFSNRFEVIFRQLHTTKVPIFLVLIRRLSTI